MATGDGPMTPRGRAALQVEINREGIEFPEMFYKSMIWKIQSSRVDRSKSMKCQPERAERGDCSGRAADLRIQQLAVSTATSSAVAAAAITTKRQGKRKSRYQIPKKNIFIY